MLENQVRKDLKRCQSGNLLVCIVQYRLNKIAGRAKRRMADSRPGKFAQAGSGQDLHPGPFLTYILKY